MAQSTIKVVLILTVIFLAVVGTSWIFVTSVSSEADVAVGDSGPSDAKVALTVVAPAPVAPQIDEGG